nr:MAG TPA: hypothetical protein [Caudoviricetes sp.]
MAVFPLSRLLQGIFASKIRNPGGPEDCESSQEKK